MAFQFLSYILCPTLAFFSIFPSSCLPACLSTLCLPVLFLCLPACLLLPVVQFVSACFFFSACLPASCYSLQLYVGLVSFSLPACLPHATVFNFTSACFFFSACLPASCYQSSTLCRPCFFLSDCLPASCYQSWTLCLPVSFSLPACLPQATVVNFMSACFFFYACLSASCYQSWTLCLPVSFSLPACLSHATSRQIYVCLLPVFWPAYLPNSSSRVNFMPVCFLSAGLPV